MIKPKMCCGKKPWRRYKFKKGTFTIICKRCNTSINGFIHEEEDIIKQWNKKFE